MKSIELTEKHKSMLLEMCKILFPNYDFRINKPLFCNNSSLSTIQLGNKDVDIYQEEIHWFEFCMTHLIEKIFNPNPDRPNRGLSDKFKEFYWKMNLYSWELSQDITHVNKHPVDYLYDEFKKLK